MQKSFERFPTDYFTDYYYRLDTWQITDTDYRLDTYFFFRNRNIRQIYLVDKYMYTMYLSQLNDATSNVNNDNFASNILVIERFYDFRFSSIWMEQKRLKVIIVLFTKKWKT